MTMGATLPGLLLDGPLATRLRARIVGHGPDLLVFCHGLGCEQSVWDGVLASLPDRYSALLFDLPGVSPRLQNDFDPDAYRTLAPFADDVLALLDEVGVRHCTLVSHSVAGMIGMLAAIEDPGRFGRLVMLNGSPRYRNDASYVGGFDNEALGGLFNAMADNFQAWVAGFATSAIPADAQSAIAAFAGCLNAMRQDIVGAVSRVIFNIDMRPLLSTVTVPTLLIHSRNDFAVPANVAHYLHRHIPGSKLAWIEANGHLPHLSAPDQVATTLWAQLDSDHLG